MSRRTDRLVSQFPQLAWRDADAAVAAELAAQSEEIILQLRPTLVRRLQLKPGGPERGMALVESIPERFIHSGPQVVLRFHPLEPGCVRARADVWRAFRAFAKLATHSQRLHAFPLLKMQFWLDVFQSDLAYDFLSDVRESALLEPSFPEFVIDLAHYKQQVAVDAALEDKLVEFMTTPASMSTPLASPTPTHKLSFGFVFRSCGLRVGSLEAIERFLTRTFASGTRQYDVRMLEISEKYLPHAALGVLERIVRKCVYEYGVEELRLDDLSKCSAAEELIPTVLEITRTVFGVDALPALESHQSSPRNGLRPSKIRRLSMNHEHMGVEVFATRFSALRYGCPLEEDVTTYWPTSSSNDRSDSCIDCWRWLAFGLFYPRPKRFASRFQLRNIGHIEHCPLMAKTVARTLRNPASELIFDGKNEQGGSDVEPTTELMVCVVQAGARVEVFQHGNSATSEWIDTFVTQCELEAIYEREDGAVCVVVPGVGLGWVCAESVVRIEREPLSAARSEQDGLFAGDLACNSQWPDEAGDRSKKNGLQASMQCLIETLGSQFYSLTFGHDHFDSRFVTTVLENCKYLRELRLPTLEISAHRAKRLFDALEPAICDRLEVLNLNAVTATNAFYDLLIARLRDNESVPVLRELRVGGGNMSVEMLTALHSVLLVNQTLELVEVHVDQVELRNDDEIADKRDRLNASFHGQLLRTTLPMKDKLAFLSVVQQHAVPLDSWLIRNIFGFTAYLEVRRKLLCNEKFVRTRRY